MASASGKTGTGAGPSLSPVALKHLESLLGTLEQRYRKALKRCQKKLSAKIVHDTRVATRRLLSLVDLLAPFIPATQEKALIEELKCRIDLLDDLRDTQVQLKAV